MDTDANRTLVSGPVIALFGGSYLNLVAPEASVITMPTIAHALGNLCRFTGHSNKFYSVAEHSYWGSRSIDPKFSREFLMHDAAEAFIGDVSSPFKGLLSDYKRIEHGLNQAIAARFGLRYPWPDEVKEMDLRMLKTERLQLMSAPGTWDVLADVEHLPIQLRCWFPAEAKKKFLNRWSALSVDPLSRPAIPAVALWEP